MEQNSYDKLKGYIGLAYRGGFLFHSSLLNKKVMKKKINLLIINRKIDEYLSDAIDKSSYSNKIIYFDIEKILNELFGLININAIGISNAHLAKQIKEILNKEVNDNGKEKQ